PGMGVVSSAVQRPCADAPRVSRRVRSGRRRRDEDRRGQQLSAGAAGDGRRGSGSGRASGVTGRTRSQGMTITPANQVTLLRMLLIPAFVIFTVYGHLGWALVAFGVAGITDALDGLIARRSGQYSTLGAWLDPMADKLLLVTAFIVLTIPGLNLANRLPIWLTICIISRDVVIVL